MMNKNHCYIVASDGQGNVRPSRVTRRDAKQASAKAYNTYEEALAVINETKVCEGCNRTLPAYYFESDSNRCYMC